MGAMAGEPNSAAFQHASTDEQVTGISQLDVYPTDWAYQALANLIERYGCVAGYPTAPSWQPRSFPLRRSRSAERRLDRVTEITDEVRRLMKAFEKSHCEGLCYGLEAQLLAN